jgi:hypothetical protein
MAKGKVTEQEVFIMKGMYLDGMSFEQIAKEVSRSAATVEKYLSDVVSSEKLPEDDVSDEQDYSDGGYTDRKNTTMFIKNSAAKTRSGISIMTDAESSRSDMTRNKRVGGKAINKKLSNNIHTISEENG